jgi:F-type H+-transporting ATPase subunit c
VNKLARIAVLCLVFANVFAPAGVLLAQIDAIIPATQSAISEEEAAALKAEEAAALKDKYAADRDAGHASYGYLGISIGVGLAAIGGGVGIGLLSASVVDASARQPEMQSKLLTTMFIAAALIEGLALFAIVVCMLCLFM